MTVSYQYDVASSTSAGFLRLLRKWKGSIYKLIYRELLVFLILFLCISAVYRQVLPEDYKRSFEAAVRYCDEYVNLIPLSFILGFYVSFVISRWWQQFENIPWPDRMGQCVSMYVVGQDETSRMIRRSLMRYINLSLVLCLRSISSAVKKRFPTISHLVETGFMTEHESKMYENYSCVKFNIYWIPSQWFLGLLQQARKMNKIEDSFGMKLIMEEFLRFRTKMTSLWCYDWVSIPLVYTQVVTISTYAFFFACLIGRQYVEGSTNPRQIWLDTYFPLYTVLQFFFYMGLLKVAEELINPFGEDDEDFELNWLIDRHIQVSYLAVDNTMASMPPVVKDSFFDNSCIELPYTEASLNLKKPTYKGSVYQLSVSEQKQAMVMPDILEDEMAERRSTLRKRTSLLRFLQSTSSVDRHRTPKHGRSRSIHVGHSKTSGESYDVGFSHPFNNVPTSQKSLLSHVNSIPVRRFHDNEKARPTSQSAENIPQTVMDLSGADARRAFPFERGAAIAPTAGALGAGDRLGPALRSSFERHHKPEAWSDPGAEALREKEEEKERAEEAAPATSEAEAASSSAQPKIVVHRTLSSHAASLAPFSYDNEAFGMDSLRAHVGAGSVVDAGDGCSPPYFKDAGRSSGSFSSFDSCASRSSPSVEQQQKNKEEGR